MTFDLHSIPRFFLTDIWKIQRSDVSGLTFFGVRVLRLVVSTLQNILGGRWFMRASVLTYYSLMSVVPALAMAFGIAKGFGFEKTLEKELYEKLMGQQEVLDWVFKFARTTLENVKGGLMAMVGLAVLFWAIFSLLSQIELAFNEIWEVPRSRTWGRRITDYLALMVILPFGLLFSSLGTVFFTSAVTQAIQDVSLLDAVSPALFLLLNLLPYLALWLLFTYLYVFLPNTKVRFWSGAVAGMVAGTAYQLFQNFYINSQIGISRYNAVYGSFAALPLFIFWLHVSWLIVLLGAEIARNHQNVDPEEFILENRKISPAARRRLALGVVYLLVKGFKEGCRDMTERKLSKTLAAPVSIVREVIQELVSAQVVSEVLTPDEETVYQPGRDPEGITIKFVLDALDHNGTEELSHFKGEVVPGLREKLTDLNNLMMQSSSNAKLKDL